MRGQALLATLTAVNHMWQAEPVLELRFGLQQSHLMLHITYSPSTSDFSHNGRQMWVHTHAFSECPPQVYCASFHLLPYTFSEALSACLGSNQVSGRPGKLVLGGAITWVDQIFVGMESCHWHLLKVAIILTDLSSNFPTILWSKVSLYGNSAMCFLWTRNNEAAWVGG